jgi:hypothetical protein
MAYEDLFSGVQGNNPYTGGMGGTYTANDPTAAAAYRQQQLSAQGLVDDGTGNYYQPGHAQANQFMQGVQSQNTTALNNSGLFGGIQGNTPAMGGGSSGGATGGGFSTGGSSGGYQQNPYLRDQMSALTGQYQQQFLQNTLPQVRGGYQASGQYGGSRQGIAEGVAAGNASTGLASALANLQAGTYQTDTSNALQGQALSNNYNLGLGSLALTNQGQTQNFYTNQRGQDLQQYGLGATLAGQGINGQQSIGQGQYTLGNTFQNAPAQAMSQYNNLITPYTGYGQSNTTTANTGGGTTGVLGGALAGANLSNRLGNFGSGGTNALGNGGYSSVYDYTSQPWY